MRACPNLRLTKAGNATLSEALLLTMARNRQRKEGAYARVGLACG
jgi:hypothetical protein